MSESGERRGKKRSKSFYKRSAHGGKRFRSGANVLEPGIRGFLVMCNNNESNAVKECYNILNEYADLLYGPEQVAGKVNVAASSEDDGECDDVEKAMKKEIDGIKNKTPAHRRFQNVHTKAKNCVFIRTTLDNPVKLVVNIMEDIGQRRLMKARYAARVLPILGTCKAHTSDIEKLAADVLPKVFSQENPDLPSSYTIIFKARNNNGSTCGKTSVIPALSKVVSSINPAVRFSWSDFEVAVLVEVVCTVCCLGVAPGYVRLRKYNLQELQQGSRTAGAQAGEDKTCGEADAETVLNEQSFTSSDVPQEVTENNSGNSIENSTLDVDSSTVGQEESEKTLLESKNVIQECDGSQNSVPEHPNKVECSDVSEESASSTAV